jgi:4-diphosphocytidyl-2-C-methyl-D-erythritol kinase
MTELTRESPAKINLTLRVVGRRPDGYHEVESLVARITLCDTVTVAPRSDRRHTLTCDDPLLPCDERNLALQAAASLAEAAGIRTGVHISLQKRIPAGAGLGGGSSNAATVLMLLNKLWRLDLSRDELARIGARVGSDVPLFLHGPVCIVRGRGEQVEDVMEPLAARVVLFLPEFHSTTRAVYEAWDRIDAQPMQPMVSEIVAQFHSPTSLAHLLFNDLEEPAFAAYPELGALAAHLRRACPVPVRMTGSGAAFFFLGAVADEGQPAMGATPAAPGPTPTQPPWDRALSAAEDAARGCPTATRVICATIQA